MTWLELQREAARRLKDGGIEEPARDARRLIEAAAQRDGAELIAIETDEAPAEAAAQLDEMVARRLTHEPVSRIRGWRGFFGRPFLLSPDVLDPRPETEILVSEGLARLPDEGRVLDLGTGSGCVLLSIVGERPDTIGVGLDISEKALETATQNAEMLGLTDRARFVLGGWDAAPEWPWDLIVSNPPYISDAEMKTLPPDVAKFDPELALRGGVEGLDPYPEIAAVAYRRLKPGGWLGLEHGAGQSGPVLAILQQAGFVDLAAYSDFSGHVRAAFGRRP